MFAKIRYVSLQNTHFLYFIPYVPIFFVWFCPLFVKNTPFLPHIFHLQPHIDDWSLCHCNSLRWALINFRLLSPFLLWLDLDHKILQQTHLFIGLRDFLLFLLLLFVCVPQVLPEVDVPLFLSTTVLLSFFKQFLKVWNISWPWIASVRKPCETEYCRVIAIENSG